MLTWSVLLFALLSAHRWPVGELFAQFVPLTELEILRRGGGGVGGLAYQDEKLIALTTHSDTQVLFWVLILNSWFSCWRFGSHAHWKYVKYVVQFHPFKYFSCVAGKHVLTNDHSPNSVFIWGKLFPKTQQRLRCKVEQRCSGLNLSNWPRRASFFSHSLEQKPWLFEVHLVPSKLDFGFIFHIRQTWPGQNGIKGWRNTMSFQWLVVHRGWTRYRHDQCCKF